ncbi:hypothetical protein N7478_007115 [Penicillium angulare]|uniref:uncharacterized protein n=1 Tax=Penicillium angulare TaxID=116970 RepID=UPI00253F8FC4|nr:uncharacterized protein N7478_007115 [Penicillium angulare]KAJ5281743.1 hypothetical protein N7478_007115 [Penicillium angulare]
MSTTTTTQLECKEARTSLSAGSSSTTLCTLPNDSSPFFPSHILHIDAHGISAFRLPLPPNQKEITITHSDGNPAYVSTRDRRWSGNSVLSHPKLGNLIRTDYFFGPNRDPVLCLLQTSSVLAEQVKVSGKWTSRSAHFTMSTGAEYEWSYAKEKRSDGQKLNLIVLRHVSGSDENGKEIQNDRRVAQLVRSSDSRTPGTSKCTAGNGGELQVDEAELQLLNLDESVVVATCLVMLKREIDRRRVIQGAVIGGAGGGS